MRLKTGTEGAPPATGVAPVPVVAVKAGRVRNKVAYCATCGCLALIAFLGLAKKNGIYRDNNSTVDPLVVALGGHHPKRGRIW